MTETETVTGEKQEPSTAVEPTVGVEQAVLEKLRALPSDKQLEVLDFVEFLVRKSQPKRPRRSLEGALAHLKIPCSEEDIAEARREMWGNFPREDIA